MTKLKILMKKTRACKGDSVTFEKCSREATTRVNSLKRGKKKKRKAALTFHG